MNEVHPKTVLMKDARLPWPTDFPYDHLAARLAGAGAAAIGPESTAAEVMATLFALQETGTPTAVDRDAWDALRHIDQRLTIDFYLYEVPAPDVTTLIDDLGCQEPPVVVPDFHRLAVVPVDWTAVDVPEAFDPNQRVDTPAPAGDAAISLDLRPSSGDWLDLLGVDHE